MVCPWRKSLSERLPQNYSEYEWDQLNPNEHLDQLLRTLYKNNWAVEEMQRFESFTAATLVRIDVLVAQNVSKNAPYARKQQNILENVHSVKKTSRGKGTNCMENCFTKKINHNQSTVTNACNQAARPE